MYKKEKSQALIISLWILAILTILAISIGRQVSMALYLSKYQKNRLKAISLAKAGINRAIVELERDAEKDAREPAQNYDSLNESWSTGKDLNDNNIFEDIEIVKDSGEKFTVCITDEERKINLNNTNKQLLKQELIELFIIKEIFSDESEAENLANIVIDWIDDDDRDSIGNKENQIFKNKPLKVTEELVAILEYFYKDRDKEKAKEVYDVAKDLITVYGDNKININTASLEVLEITFKTIALINNIPTVEGETQDLAKIISDYREGGIDKYFTSQDLNDASYVIGKLSSVKDPTDNQSEIIRQSLVYLAAVSNNFKIEATGKVGNTIKTVTAIYDRSGEGKFVYWHEN